ncbi:hypothetical protein [Vulcanisaeta distributa]|uniref:VapB-type antitoxin n=1 Tax=Vulcanisaeta distributa (strain DSM 14429 / JCM 11212 / NBRC 100878 / IC-017) TaxID=572478 RepID=E1QRZ6_VULDI|nr:hypothetical protein [Vulcanisaeta distributa]ADN50713.1 conserved hypothetical protein [Vulcanisaeta distributa DSM 14429]
MGSVVKIDNRGRIRLPGRLAKYGSVIIIDVGEYFIGIPIPKDPLTATSGIIKSEKSVGELKKEAEEEAAKDALERARRMGHAD